MGNKFICDETCIAHTKAGDLQGYFFNDVYNFKGIQYATAKRFQGTGTGGGLERREGCHKLWLCMPVTPY